MGTFAERAFWNFLGALVGGVGLGAAGANGFLGALGSLVSQRETF